MIPWKENPPVAQNTDAENFLKHIPIEQLKEKVGTNRLKKLRMGVRQQGGKEYTYTFLGHILSKHNIQTKKQKNPTVN